MKEILGIRKGASKDEIKRAYKKKILCCYPNKRNNSKNLEKLERLMKYS
jgi:curved DNA-binding protein CbpA